MKNCCPCVPELCWHPVLLDEAARYDTFVRAENASGADFSFANVYLWDGLFRQHIAYIGDRAVVRVDRPGAVRRYVYPIGAGPLAPAVETCAAEAHRDGLPFLLCGVPEDSLPLLLAECPGRFTVTEERKYADYLYDAESLSTLAGRKLHGKRNHIHAFEQAHRSALVPLSEENLPLCLPILEAWDAESERDETALAEHEAVLRALSAFRALRLSGALLTAEDKPVAFTVGERISTDTFCIHFEKALPGFESAYPVINRDFVRLLTAREPDIRLINREDDLGLENLRAAKLSYHPARLFRKFLLTENHLPVAP